MNIQCSPGSRTVYRSLARGSRACVGSGRPLVGIPNKRPGLGRERHLKGYDAGRRCGEARAWFFDLVIKRTVSLTRTRADPFSCRQNESMVKRLGFLSGGVIFFLVGAGLFHYSVREREPVQSVLLGCGALAVSVGLAILSFLVSSRWTRPKSSGTEGKSPQT
jgi:hypothetical protein